VCDERRRRYRDNCHDEVMCAHPLIIAGPS
jgi:hypothetical protein